VLIERQTLEHRAAFFQLAVMQIREAQRQHDLQDMIVVVERTGNYHLAPKRAFAKAGFETRVVHPFATRQYRMPADLGIKTDGTDLNAQHRAAVAGFGLCELEPESPYRELQLRARHRRNLVEKACWRFPESTWFPPPSWPARWAPSRGTPMPMPLRGAAGFTLRGIKAIKPTTIAAPSSARRIGAFAAR
jgi:hypothetical protein